MNNKKSLERKSIQEEIDIARAKKSMLEKAVVSLSQDADKYAMDVESKFNAMEMKELIKKSTFSERLSLRSRSKLKHAKKI